MIHVCDNFLEDCYEVRRIALGQKYAESEHHNYPGRRSSDVPEGVKNYITAYVRHITQNLSLEIN